MSDIISRHIQLDFPITHISKNDGERRVVAGYASFDVIDRQNERITDTAMRDALDKFMSNEDYANVHVMHGNCAVGKVIPVYTDMNGERWETKVDDTGTFIVSEIRPEGELKRADQTWQLIKDGNLKSYSVGGLALSPKELVCPDTGSCHFVIDELEIHEFSYVDKPAVKGADFIIVKQDGNLRLNLDGLDPRPKAMTCPLKEKQSDTPRVSTDSDIAEIRQLNKQQSPNSEVIIMTEDLAEQVLTDPKPELAVPEEVVDTTEKQDATPLLLEMRGMLEKILNALEQKPSESEESKKFDYPEKQVSALQLKYGEEKAFHLLELLAEEAFTLLDKVEDDIEANTDDTSVEPEAETVTEEQVEEMIEGVAEVLEEVEAKEVVGLVPDTNEEVKETLDKVGIIAELQGVMESKVEEAIEKLTPVQKRSPGPQTVVDKPLYTLQDLASMPWTGVEALASRGA